MEETNDDYCYECGAPIDWNAIPWDVGTYKRAVVKEYDCKCGNKPSIFYFKDKELKTKLLNKLFGD